MDAYGTKAQSQFELWVALNQPKLPKVNRTRKPACCRCGKCTRCLDDARWELIFQQKFADPTYYQSTAPRHRSALSDF